MKRLAEAIKAIFQGLLKAVSRFPLTVLCLLGAAILVCYMISLHKEPELIIQKLMFTFLLGAFLGVAAQFSCERFKRIAKMRLFVYGAAALITLGYYLIIASAPNISFEVEIRTFVAVFAMFCVFLWVPSYRESYDFNRITLIHFKSAFTAVLYSAVLSAGCASIIAAVDILLFKVNPDTYGYTMSIIWILFAPLYYLSLLPRFNSEDESELELARHAGEYPRILEILISYIAIPLVAAYSLVLAAYFIKILVTFKWPSGQLGGMVLAYSAAGLLIYILASLLNNRFAVLYQRIFPKVLIPVVIMQLISVGIRLNAYGITESRYYVTLFGIASIVCAILLSFKPVTKNGLIVLLVAGFAIISVIPPVDAFTVSRVSQINRLEEMLQAEKILADGKITPRAEASMNLRQESTSILNYLERRHYLKNIKWLPADFNANEDMLSVFGFEPAYPNFGRDDNFFFAGLDMNQVVNINDYDVMVLVHSYRGMVKDEMPEDHFTIRGTQYQIGLERLSPQELRVSIKDDKGTELVGTGLNKFVKSLRKTSNSPKEALDPEEMTFDIENNGYKLRIMFQEVNVIYGGGADAGVDYNFYLLFGAPGTEQ